MNGSGSNTSGKNVATIEWTRKVLGDLVPDEVVEELARRLSVLFEGDVESNIILSPTAPGDTSKIWWKTDPVTNLPIGRPQTYNSESAQWSEESGSDSVVALKEVYGSFFTPAGGSLQTVNFEGFGHSNYMVNLSPTLLVNGTWQSGPGANTMTFQVNNKADNQFTAQFYAVPTGGMTWDYEIKERP